MMNEKIQDQIQQDFFDSPLCETFSKELCQLVWKTSHLRSFRKDYVLFTEGEVFHGLYIILSGSVKLVRYSADGRESILHLSHEHQLIAEAALFLGKYPATCIPVTDSVMLQVGKESLDHLLDTYPQFTRMFFNSMANWLQRLVSKIDQLTLSDATARIARFLLDSPVDSLQDEITLPLKKGDLASMLNIQQATLSRVFRTLQDDSIINVDSRTIQIVDRKRLSEKTLPPID